MRILRLAVVGLAAATAVLLGQREALAFESFFMTLSPSWGPSNTQITANYILSANGQCSISTVSFSWDGRPLGEAPVNRTGNQNQGYCLARLTFTPPGGLATPGRHVVHGEGKGRRNPLDATFTITGTAAPAPPARPTPTPTATRAKPSARPSASATPSTTPSAEPSVNAEPAVVPTGSTAAVPQAAVKSSSGGGSIGTVIAVVVMALTIIGAGLLAGLVLRKRGDGPEVGTEIMPVES